MEEQTKLDDSGERISYGDGMAIRLSLIHI